LGIPYAEPVKRFESNNLDLYWVGPEVEEMPPLHSDHPLLHMSSQPHVQNFLISPPGRSEFSEDCLRINVFKPVAETDQPYPILVWVPGEGYSISDMALYDGTYVASKGNIIVVTVNYRLGKQPNVISIRNIVKLSAVTIQNSMVYSILTALKLMIPNAEEFNGDPESITLGGRFSRAKTISSLLTMDSLYR